LQDALAILGEVSSIGSTMCESAAPQVYEEGLNLATDAECLRTRVKKAMDSQNGAQEARDALQRGEELIKQDKLSEATTQVALSRAALLRVGEQEEAIGPLKQQAALLECAIRRAYAAEEADGATSQVRERVGAADFEGARAAVIKAADALQRAEMADHESIVLNMLSQVNLAEQVHRARAQGQELLTEAECALAAADEVAARRVLDAAHRAVEVIGAEALEHDMRARFAKLEDALGARDEAVRCIAAASKAVSVAEQNLAAQLEVEAREALERAGDDVDTAARIAEGRVELKEQVY